MRWNDGRKYIGNFKEGFLHGYGILYLSIQELLIANFLLGSERDKNFQQYIWPSYIFLNEKLNFLL